MDGNGDQHGSLPSPELPPSVQQLLTRCLPFYARSRQRWPLWTYQRTSAHELSLHDLDSLLRDDGVERSAAGGAKRRTWHGSGGWADRLAWSPARLYQPFYKALVARAEQLGWALVEWQPGESAAFLEKQQIAARDAERSWDAEVEAEGWLTLPHLLRALDAAIAAQTAPTIPGTPDEAEHDDFWFNDGLGLIDGTELARSLFRELLAPRTWPGEVSRKERFQMLSELGAAVEKPGRKPRISLLSRMLRYQLDAVTDPALLGSQERLQEDRNALAAQLSYAVGLLPERDRRHVLPVTMILRLYEEALDIVRDLRSWRPDGELMDHFIAVADGDPGFELGHLRRERARRIESRADVGTVDVAQWARQLCYPFLLSDEILIATNTKKGQEKMNARRLVMGRLPGFDPDEDDQVFQVEVLSKARRELRASSSEPAEPA